ncbi:MAG: hypothetical protein VX186_08190 [Nitrospinota bacterium]|nr:hypothetical protein [Nitrospinota bacterium]
MSEFITGEGNPSDALKTIHQDWFCYRQEIRGEHKNEDILIPLQ